MATAKSEFLQWFEAQFGKRPLTEKRENEMFNHVKDLRLRVREIDNKLVAVKNWDDWQTAALYFWNAREGKHEKGV